jgi:cell division protein FtsZ
MADDVLRQGVQGISDLVTNPGVINLDFADVKAIMENAGEALMGIGHGAGDNRAEDAAKQAVSSPLLETSIDGAKGILFNITAGKDITLQEVQKAAEIVRAAADPSANIIFGVVRDDTMQGEIKITVIATGFGAKSSTEVRHDTQRKALERERPEFGTDEMGDINIPAFLRNRM